MVQNKIRNLGSHRKTWGLLGKSGETWGLLGDSWGYLGKLGVSWGHQKLSKFFPGHRGATGLHGATEIPGLRERGGGVSLYQRLD